MALDVKVKIDLSKPIGSAGSWYPLLCVVDSTAQADSYGEYTELTELVTAGYTATSNVYKAANLMLMQDNKPSKFAVLKMKEFATTSVATYLNKGWRQMVFVDAGDNAKDMAEYIETTDKMLFLTVSDKTKLATLYTSVKSYDRTFIVYHTDSTNYPDAAAAVVGATAGYEAGSFTYKNIIVKGVTPLDISDTDLEADVHTKGAITILEKAGDIVTSEGKVASGEYADVVDSKDYIVQNIAYKVQKVFNNNKKVAYTNAGISLLEVATGGVLKAGYDNGMIAENDAGAPLFSTNFALRSQTTESDRASRKYPYGQFSFELAGAIHNAEITGEITV